MATAAATETPSRGYERSVELERRRAEPHAIPLTREPAHTEYLADTPGGGDSNYRTCAATAMEEQHAHYGLGHSYKLLSWAD